MARRGRGGGAGRGGRGGSRGGRRRKSHHQYPETRRPATRPDANDTGGQLSQGEQETRLQELRDLLYPQITTNALLRQFLEAARWNVERAHARWTTIRERVLAGDNASDSDSSFSLSSLSSSSSKNSGNLRQNIDAGVELERLPFNNNVEQERRDAALFLRLQIEELHNVVLSRAEAVLLLQLADWDLGTAIATFENHEEARNRLRIAFDGMRTNTYDENQQSARLARLLEITERSDWLALKICLQKVKWDLVQAVIDWHKTGIVPLKNDVVPRGSTREKPHWACRVDTNGRVRSRPTEEECTAASEEDASAWADDTVDFTNPDAKQSPTPIIPGKDDEMSAKDRKRSPGFILHYRPYQPQKPCPVDTKKFLLEYIQNGTYRFDLFQHEMFFWPDRVDSTPEDRDDESDSDASASSSDSVTSSSRLDRPKPAKAVAHFDWATSSHMQIYNNWRRQNFVRIRGDSFRPRAQQWVQEELDYIYEINQDWFNDLKEQHPYQTRKELLETTEITITVKRDWTRRMNERFTGTTPQGAKGPRWDRNFTAIMTQRSRIPRLHVHFRVNPDKKWLKKADPAELARLEAERDAMENIDLLLTANATMRRDSAAAQAQNDDEDEDGAENEDEGDQEETEDAREHRDDADQNAE